MEWPAAHACAQSMCGSVQMDSFLFGHMNVMIFRQTRRELYTTHRKKDIKFNAMYSRPDNLQIIHPASLDILPSNMA